MRRRRTIAERFWAKVEKTDACWLWLGATYNGYGRFTISPGNQKKAHRFAYEALIGPIADGMTLDHLCRVRNCVNPEHLEQVTHEENLARIPARTHCPRGHEYNEANAHPQINPKTGRVTARCRTCWRERAAARYQARKAAAA